VLIPSSSVPFSNFKKESVRQMKDNGSFLKDNEGIEADRGAKKKFLHIL